MEIYHLSNGKIIVGDSENALAMNSIILTTTTKVIYNAMKKEQQHRVFNVKNDNKKFYFLEKYRHYIKGRWKQFQKKYLLLSNSYAKKLVYLYTTLYLYTSTMYQFYSHDCILFHSLFIISPRG